MQLVRHLAVGAFALPIALACAQQGTAHAAPEATPAKPAETMPAKPAEDKPAAKPEAKTMPAAEAMPVVVMKTSMGEIKIRLNRDKAPISSDNFLAYVDEKFFDGTIFHRTMKDFMIQGGGFTPDRRQKSPTHPSIKNEGQNGLKNKRGTIAMARTSDPNSATNQFFINVVDNASLDYPSFDGHGYAVFGEVIEGMDVVDKIRQTPVKPRGGDTLSEAEPVTQVLIESVRRAGK